MSQHCNCSVRGNYTEEAHAPSCPIRGFSSVSASPAAPENEQPLDDLLTMYRDCSAHMLAGVRANIYEAIEARSAAPESQDTSDLRAALAQSQANSDDISAHLAAMTETARKLRTRLAAQVARPLPTSPVIAWYRDQQMDVNSDSQGLPPRYITHRAICEGTMRPSGEGWKALVEPAAVGALPVPAAQKNTDELAHVMPRFAAPAGQHGDSGAVLLAVKDALTLLSRNQIGTRWMRSDAAIASAALGVIADYHAATVEQSNTAGSAKGGMHSPGTAAAVEVARQPDEPSAESIAALVVRDVCELSYEGEFDEERMAAVSIDDLTRIVKRHARFAAPSSQAAPNAENLELAKSGLREIIAASSAKSDRTYIHELARGSLVSLEAAPDAKAERAPTDFGQEVTRLVGEIRKPCSLAWRDSLVEQLIELIDPSPAREFSAAGKAHAPAAPNDCQHNRQSTTALGAITGSG